MKKKTLSTPKYQSKNMLESMMQEEEKKKAYANKLKEQAEGRSKRAHSRALPLDDSAREDPNRLGSASEAKDNLSLENPGLASRNQIDMPPKENAADAIDDHDTVEGGQGGTAEGDGGGERSGTAVEGGGNESSESSEVDELSEGGNVEVKEKKKPKKKKKTTRNKKRQPSSKEKEKAVEEDDSSSESSSSVDLKKSYKYLVEDNLCKPSVWPSP